MKENNLEVLKPYLEAASDELLDFISSENFTGSLKQEVENFQVSEYEWKIENLLIGVMLGIIDPSDLPVEFIGLGMDEQKAMDLAVSLTKNIINPHAQEIITLMDKVYGPDDFEDDEDELENELDDPVLPPPPVPTPPSNQQPPSNIENIRPRPIERNGDPYREIPE